ncbi:MAG: hypothetical protein V4640_02085 [Verrucomicrobiota bacterium]
MDTSKIKAIIVAIIALFAALYLGISAATAQFETIAWVLGGVTLSVCLLMGRKIWLLIPFLGSVELTLNIQGQPSTMLLAQILVIGFSFLLLLMRRLPFRIRFTELELWIILLTLFIVQVYARNPVGFSLFGTSSVGGKPYVLFLITLITALLLAGLRVPPEELKTALRLSIFGGIINFGVSLVGRFVPSIGVWTGASHPGAGVTDYTNAGEAVDTGRATREYFLVLFSRNLSLWISSYRSPLMACFHPIWAPLVLITLVAAGLSGFRNAVATVGLTYLVGICYRGGFIQIVLSSLSGIVILALLAIVNAVAPFPPNLQRALSFLPGSWEQRYIDDAEGSTEWRVEIWKEVLFTDRWINNKTFGDGLGFTAKELAYQASITDGYKLGRGLSGFDFQRESILANGDYHSGPVQTIRIVGYSGLVVLLLFQIRLAVYAHRQIIRCRGTEWFALALFFGIPLIWNPIFFIFIFGDFKSAATTVLLGSAMIRMLQNNLPIPAWRPARRQPFVLNQKAFSSLPASERN